jgi:hypothetical protein
VNEARRVPDFLDEDGRRAYLSIAARSRTECAHAYTVVVLGCELFVHTQKVMRARDGD